MLVACILGSAIVFVDSTVVNVALPAIQGDLGGGLALQQWVVDAYLLTLGSLLLVGGSLGDLFGGARCSWSGSSRSAITSIAVRGGARRHVADPRARAAGRDGRDPHARRAGGDRLDVQRRGARRGDRHVDGVDRRRVRDRPARGRLARHERLLAMGVHRQRALRDRHRRARRVCRPADESAGPRPRVDFVGAVLCVLGLGGPVFALIEEPRRGLGDPLILLPLVAGIALFATFLWWESHHPQPMLPLGLFRRRNFTFANLETLTVYAGLSTLTFFLVLFLQQLAGYTALRSGLALLPITVIMFLFSPRVGRLSMRLGPRFFMSVGPLIAAAALAGIARLSPGFDYWYELMPALLVFAVGLSMIVAPLTATVLADADESDAGIASGVNNAVARVAGLLGIAVVGASVAGPDNRLDLSGFRLAMIITAVLVAAGGAIGFAGVRNRPREAARP